MHERPGLRTFHVAGFERVDSEPRGTDQIVHLAVEMASAADPFPARRQMALPADYPRFVRQTMLHEQQPSIRLEDAPHLVQSGARVWDRAQGPGRYQRVESGL